MPPVRPVLFVLLLASVAVARPITKHQTKPTGVDRKMSATLRTELDRFEAMVRTQGVSIARERFARRMERHPLLRVDPEGRVLVSVRLTDHRTGVDAELVSLGAQVGHSSARWKTVEAWIPLDRLRGVASHPSVNSVRPIERPTLRAGSRMTEGDAILGADLVRQMGHDGTGIKVGVMSDGVAGMAAARASGDLPSVTILAGYEGPSDGAEGTAMLEIVHDLAPGAELFFASAWDGQISFADGIAALADAGCDVIVDDVGYFGEPFFEDGIVAQAVDEVNARGVSYVCAAGNSAQEHYQRDYAAANPPSLADSNAYHWHAWDGAGDSTLALVVPPKDTVLVFMQWTDRFGHALTDYDMFLFRSPALHPFSDDPDFNVVAIGGDYQGPDQPSDPFEMLGYVNGSQSPETTYVAVDLYAGDPKFLSLFVIGASHVERIVSEGSIWGHPNARGAMAVGAINADEPGNDRIASYSSWGPAEIYFPARETRLKPDITGIDGVSVTGSGGFPSTFYGTSASAPHLAAAAALLRDAHPSWGPDKVLTALTNTAIDYGDAGPDVVYGYGLAQADAAVSAMGETFVSGTVATTTWTKLMEPYRVTSTITVPVGNTLTIEPGVDVLFDADVQFIVQGALHAVGTASDSIRFMKGTAAEWGGIRVSGGDSSTIAYARISDGNADSTAAPGNRGGGIYVSGATTRLALAQAVISNNTSAENGGGVYVSSAKAALRNCTLRDNVAGQNGGALYILAATGVESGVLDHCVVAGNTAVAGNGAGINLNGTGAGTFVHCTIAGNVGVNPGGGLYVSPYCTALATGCIIWGNTPDAVWNRDSTLAVAYSDVTAGWAGTGNINADPRFVDAEKRDYRLLLGSPCIDAGDPASPFDPDGTRADVGAFYMHRQVVSGTVTTTAWVKSNSPYRVTGAVSVPSGSTLTIEAGVDVLFDADVQFVVEGSLQAVGTKTDSVRFTRGLAAKWGGIHFTDGDSSTLLYVRISDAFRDGNGGGILLSGTGTRLTVVASLITQNTADLSGGGIAATDGATLKLSTCTITGNIGREGSGGLSVIEPARAELTRCAIVGNVGMSGSEVVIVGGGYSPDALFVSCTIVGNKPYDIVPGFSLATPAVSVAGYSYVSCVNTIVWGETTDEFRKDATATFMASYSNVRATAGLWPGQGNLSTDPRFVDPENGDYRLLVGSPCIDAGDPDSPPDPDGTRADMGAFTFLRPYGDATGDGSLSAYDAALILRSVVEFVPVPYPLLSDVTGNGSVSAYDAAFILTKLVDPGFQFPVETGHSAPGTDKPASLVALDLRWVREGSDWTLHARYVGMLAGELVIALPDDAPMRVTGGDQIAYGQDRTTLRLAFVRLDDDDPVLFRLGPREPLGGSQRIDAAPSVVYAQFNEGAVTLRRVTRPAELALEPNAPNPFNPTTTLRFSVPDAGVVRLAVYDVTGRLVCVLADGIVEAGFHEVVWDGRDSQRRDMASGVYLYRLSFAADAQHPHTNANSVSVRRMTLLR